MWTASGIEPLVARYWSDTIDECVTQIGKAKDKVDVEWCVIGCDAIYRNDDQAELAHTLGIDWEVSSVEPLAEAIAQGKKLPVFSIHAELERAAFERKAVLEEFAQRQDRLVKVGGYL
jgi:hypothetical protein